MPTIEKPCIRKCTLNKEDICLGCFRSFDDMRKWHQATRDEKAQMLMAAAKRKQEHTEHKAVLTQAHTFI